MIEIVHKVQGNLKDPKLSEEERAMRKGVMMKVTVMKVNSMIIHTLIFD